MNPRPHPDEDPCPWCGDELQDGCCDHCDDRYAANDDWPAEEGAA